MYVAAEHSASIAVFERDPLSGLLPSSCFFLHLHPYTCILVPYTCIPTPASSASIAVFERDPLSGLRPTRRSLSFDYSCNIIFLSCTCGSGKPLSGLLPSLLYLASLHLNPDVFSLHLHPYTCILVIFPSTNKAGDLHPGRPLVSRRVAEAPTEIHFSGLPRLERS